MNKEQAITDSRIKKTAWGFGKAALTYLIMLLLVGIQMGIIVSAPFQFLSDFWKINLILLYWVLITIVFINVTNRQIRFVYDKPMRILSKATKKVASGDFSVYVEPRHTVDKYDYIDVLFLDFNKMVAELGSIETLKNDFVANVSHEIKTPLAVIQNYTKALQNTELSVETKNEYMDIIVKTTEKLSSLISNILRLNKIENQEISTTPEPFDLCEQLCDCTLGFESFWESKKINFIVDIEDKATIAYDRESLEIVWNNLISNAIKFTPDGGKITLKQYSQNHEIIISITDTGCGMDCNTMQHIFDKFYQGDTSHSTQGNGLGLALAKRIIDRMGGTLSVVSELSKGSTFIVVLPIK
ncbi:HAMP domain-containing sensor histidine kinase [Anaerorhabdus sp.]|uniref:HAMP domain-containing sensor histidine kinase n=1 Tax=Anaerorhabdus sp. TaxID=1872524 RepID=UPI002FC82239